MLARRCGKSFVKRLVNPAAAMLLATACVFVGIGKIPEEVAAGPKTKSLKSTKSAGTNKRATQTVQAQSVTSPFTMGWGYNFLFTSTGGSPVSADTDWVTIDAAGNTIIAFTGYGIGNLDPAQSAAGAFQNTAGGHKAGLAKYDPSGTFLWMMPMFGTGVSYTRGVVAGPTSGDLYIVGDFYNSCTFTTSAGTTLTLGNPVSGPRIGYVARLEAATGRVVWMNAFNPGPNALFLSVACDAAENVYLCGSVNGNGTASLNSAYGSGTAGLPLVADNSASNASTRFFVKCDKNGNGNWLHMGPGIWITSGFSVDGSGNLYFTGNFSGTQDFDFSAATHNITAIGSQDTYLEKLDTNGSLVWVKQFGQAASNSKGKKNSTPAGTYFGTATGSDGNGNVDLSLSGANSTTVTAYGLTGNLWQFDTNGNPRWAVSISEPLILLNYTAFPFCLDRAGDIYTAAFFGTVQEYNPSGARVASPVTLDSGVSPWSCAADAAGNFVFGGTAVDGSSTNVTGQQNVSPTSTPYYVPAWGGTSAGSVLVVRWNRQ